ncbi:MAG: SMP-30/gluconolactonase/LRE family protein [Methylobacteriaceae bacterium]|nr:SMP-30/gluconolactonase/LRE family protein [Methylobacteriaceae bacterium]
MHRVGDFTLTWGESLRWDERRQRLYFVDVAAETLHWLDHAEPPLQTFKLPSRPTGLVLSEDTRRSCASPTACMSSIRMPAAAICSRRIRTSLARAPTTPMPTMPAISSPARSISRPVRDRSGTFPLMAAGRSFTRRSATPTGRSSWKRRALKPSSSATRWRARCTGFPMIPPAQACPRLRSCWTTLGSAARRTAPPPTRRGRCGRQSFAAGSSPVWRQRASTASSTCRS